MGAWLGRKTKPDLSLGVCGEHGGDPDSIEFLQRVGHRLRLLLALPGADRADRRRSGGDTVARPQQLDGRERRDVTQEGLDLEALAGRLLDDRDGVQATPVAMDVAPPASP